MYSALHYTYCGCLWQTEQRLSVLWSTQSQLCLYDSEYCQMEYISKIYPQAGSWKTYRWYLSCDCITTVYSIRLCFVHVSVKEQNCYFILEENNFWLHTCRLALVTIFIRTYSYFSGPASLTVYSFAILFISSLGAFRIVIVFPLVKSKSSLPPTKLSHLHKNTHLWSSGPVA